MTDETPLPPPSDADEISFDYIKGSDFRSIHVDGIFGGPSPNGRYLRVTLFNERLPIPTRTIHDMTPEGRIGEEAIARREGRTAIVRELEADLVLDYDTALAFWVWLGGKLQSAGKISVKAEEPNGPQD